MRKTILRSHEFYLFVLMIAYSVIVHSISKSFLTAENMFDILKSSSIMGVMAIGAFIVMLSGGIDISFPAIATVSMYVTVRILEKFSGNLFLAFSMASAFGVMFGCVNALLVHFFKIPTLIVTLGTSSIFHGTMLSVVRIPHIYTVPGYFFEFSNIFDTQRAASILDKRPTEHRVAIVAFLFQIGPHTAWSGVNRRAPFLTDKLSIDKHE